jgi:hypothetical protein
MEVAKYSIVYSLSSRKKLEIRDKRALYAMPVVMIGLIGAERVMTVEGAYVLILFGAVMVMFLNMTCKIVRRIWNCLIIFLSVTAVDSIFENIYTNYFSKEGLYKEVEFILWDGFLLVSLAAVYVFFFAYLGISGSKKKIYSHIFVRIASIIVDICLCLCGTSIIRSAKGDNVHFAFGILTLISVVLLGSQIVGMLDRNSELYEGINHERLLRGIQKEHYQSLLRNDKDIRKYRHDMINHFMVIESYLDKGKIDSAREYIDDLKGDFMATAKNKYCVGNDVIDAISCYYLTSIEDVAQVTVRGTVPEDIEINEVCLCTVYSNLLKNAVEEILRLKETRENNLELNIEFKTGKRFFEMIIKNTTHYNTIFDGMNTQTSKTDSKNHGIGLSSILYAIRKENGDITLDQKDGCVCADAIFPMGNKYPQEAY